MLTAEDIKSIATSGEGYNVEFKVRVPSKVRELTEEICAFVNSEGGYLLIGIADNGKIVGDEIDNAKRSAIQNSIRDISPNIQTQIYSVDVDGKTIWVIDVPIGEHKPYLLSGAIYVRESANSQKLTTATEIMDFFQKSDRIFFDAIPCPDVDLKSIIDKENFHEFRLESKLSSTVTDEQVLDNLRIFDKKGVVKRGGVLFFSQHPENLYPQAIVRCVLFKGIDKVYIIDDKKYGGTLYHQYQQAMSWLESKLQVAYIIEGKGPRKEVWEIPLTVFKEAIINALSHRDYYEQGAVTTIEIFDDRVEISNPGGLLMSIANDFGKRSKSRNPLVFGLFTRMNLVEQIASGIPRMRSAMKEAKLEVPVFTYDDAFFTVTFQRPNKQSSISEIVPIKNISVNQQKVIDAIQANERITFVELSQMLKVSNVTINKYIRDLKQQGIIDRIGSKTDGKWVLLKDVK